MVSDLKYTRPKLTIYVPLVMNAWLVYVTLRLWHGVREYTQFLVYLFSYFLSNHSLGCPYYKQKILMAGWTEKKVEETNIFCYADVALSMHFHYNEPNTCP